jgi:hypothetical protein
MTCPSDLKLEAHLLDAAHSPVAAHVAGCDRCRGRLQRMEREGEDFRRFVYPATLAALEKRPPRSWLWVKFAAPVAALAAAAVVLAVRTGPPDDYSGTKGAALKLTVYAGLGERARALGDREAVPANASLRFRVQPSGPCHLAIVSVDETAHVSRLFPPTGEEAVSVTKMQVLPGGAVLDGRAGPERIYAVCAAAPVPLSRIEEAAHAVSAPGSASVRSGGPLRGLPQGSAQATLLLEKIP